MIAKLKTLKQKDSAENFCNEVEKLTSQLKSIYIREQIPVDRAHAMATKKGVETLINGTKTDETRIILKAGTFTKMNDAIQKLLENETSTNNTNNVSNNSNAKIFTNRAIYSRGRGGTNRRGSGNYSRGNNSQSNYHGQSGRYQNNQSNRGNYPSNQRGNRYQRGNYGNQRGNWTPRGQFNPNMYLAQHNGVLYQPVAQQGIQQLPVLPPNQVQQQQQYNPQQANIHPLGVQLGQHLQ